MIKIKNLFLILLFICTLNLSTFAQSPPPLKITEVDGSPAQTNATQLIFPNGTLTKSGSKITVDLSSLGGGTVSNTNTLTVGKAIIGDGLANVKASKVTITDPATAAVLTIANNKTFTVSNTLTFTGTDSSSVAFGVGGTVAYQADNLSVFAATTSAQLAGVISNETGSSLLVFNTSPTLVTPVLGVATATSVNKIAITAPATGATLTISDGGSLITVGGHSLTFTTSNTTNVTLPTIGTLATLAGSETFTNKTLTTPTIASFANANHNHTNSAGGGTLAEAALALTDITTNDASASKHGFLPKLSGNAAEYLKGDGTWGAGGGGGATINATDGVIPYRSNSTTFADSPLVRSSANTIEQKNSTNRQTFRVFETDTGSTSTSYATEILSAGSTHIIRAASLDGGDFRELALIASYINLKAGGTTRLGVGDSVVKMRAAITFGWTDGGADSGDTIDTGLARSAAGIIKPTDGSSGYGRFEMASARYILSGSGSPESAVTASIGSIYMRTDGGAGTSMYVKESGTGNTGWVAK